MTAHDKHDIGQTQTFVLARGFVLEQDGESVLIGYDGSRRYFYELTADPDRPEVRPELAYRQILASMQPGWAMRVLYITWPDPSPRQAYLEQVRRWQRPGHEGMALLYDALELFIERSALPFIRRTILEFSAPPVGTDDAVAWWRSIPSILAGYGVRAVKLEKDDVTTLAGWILSPRL